jgi:hypothetical protein
MKNLFILTFFIAFNAIYSQDYTLGKVTIDQLKETQHKTESDAVAAILFKVGKVHFDYTEQEGFSIITNVVCKIKIYKKEGFDWANFQQKIYSSGNAKESVNFKNAITYNLVDGKIEKTKLKSNGEFTEKLNKFWDIKKIVMPNVKEGSIIEFEYILKSNDISNIDRWNFQEEIPVDYSEFQLRTPEYYSYNANYRGNLFVKTTKSSADVNLSFTEKERVGGGIRTPVRTEFTQSKLSYKDNIVYYKLSNVPSIYEESFVKNISNYTSSVSHELSSIQYPNKPFKLISTTWDEVAKTIYESENFGEELSKKGFFEDEVDKIILGKNTDDEKIIALFDFVKNNYKWNSYFGIYTDEGLRSVFKNKTGNVADLNLLLTSFLRHAGLNANPVLISSVSNGIPLFPSRTAFNYVVAGVELNGKTILLDATDKNALPNILPARAMNWVGRLIYPKGGSKEVDLQPTITSKDNIIINYSISPEGTATGNVKRQLTNYNAYNYRNNYGSQTKESIIENLQKRFDNIEIDDYSNENTSNLSVPIIETYSFTDDKHIEVIGDKIYFSPLLFFSLDSNPFKKEVRSYPIEFPFPYSDKYAIKINIPEGYSVESLPQNESLVFNEKELTHKYILSQDETTLTLALHDEVNAIILTNEIYTELKEYFQKIVSKQTEKIVLKKN